jgi:hypothetical protein
LVQAEDPPSFLATWGSNGSGNGEFNYPYGIAVDSQHRVYVADMENHRIQKFDSDGNFLLPWGSLGSGNGEFDYPVRIAVDSQDRVYAADALNYRIQKFDSDGNHLTTWGSYGSGNGEFYGPYDIAVDSQDRVYVVDTWNSRIQKFDSDGNFHATWGSLGSGNGEFNYPYGIAVDSLDRIYVADTQNNRIQVFGYPPTGIADQPTVRPQLTVSCYPNPFNPSTTISYTVPKSGAVTLTVYDVTGKLVARLVDRTFQTVGLHDVEYRHPGASGVYFARLTVGGQSRTVKLVILK